MRFVNFHLIIRFVNITLDWWPLVPISFACDPQLPFFIFQLSPELPATLLLRSLFPLNGPRFLNSFLYEDPVFELSGYLFLRFNSPFNFLVRQVHSSARSAEFHFYEVPRLKLYLALGAEPALLSIVLSLTAAPLKFRKALKPFDPFTLWMCYVLK